MSRHAVIVADGDVHHRAHLEAICNRSGCVACIAAAGSLVAANLHDVANPLSVILGTTSLALEDIDSGNGLTQEEVRESLATTLEEARWAKDLISTLQSLHRWDRVAPRRIQIAPILDTVCDLVRPQAKQSTRLEKIFDAAPPVTAKANRLGQVILNLLLNAFQALPERDAERNLVTLRLGTLEDGRAFITVEDNGVGMAREVSDRVFDPFFTTKGESGSGLGLYISAAYVQEMGGVLDVSSKPGQGAQFRVILPAAGTADGEKETAD